jgi:hypothetical protein
VHVAIHCELVVRQSTGGVGAEQGGEPVGLAETARQMAMEAAPSASDIAGTGQHPGR